MDNTEEYDDTLVKYDSPYIVTTHVEKEKEEKPLVKPITQCFQPTRSANRTREIVNEIIKPKEWKADGVFWRQEGSLTAATAADVHKLREQLDTRLRQRGARGIGICNVRRQLYDQCFDELIRQVTLDCTDRGLLLLRIREEIKMTMQVYNTLYCSCVAFGVRKTIVGQDMRDELMKKIDELTETKKALEKQLYEQRAKAEQFEKTTQFQRETEEKLHNEQVQFYKKQNQQLKAQLENMLVPKK